MTRIQEDDLQYVYPISIVEQMTGLTRRRIRYYEQAGLIAPRRSEGGHRLYSFANVEMLRRIKSLIDSGITSMESVRRMISADLDLVITDRQNRGTLPPAASSCRPRELGDAAVRVMRPVEPRLDAAGKPGESDSRAFFNRSAVIPKQGKDGRNR